MNISKIVLNEKESPIFVCKFDTAPVIGSIKPVVYLEPEKTGVIANYFELQKIVDQIAEIHMILTTKDVENRKELIEKHKELSIQKYNLELAKRGRKVVELRSRITERIDDNLYIVTPLKYPAKWQKQLEQIFT